MSEEFIDVSFGIPMYNAKEYIKELLDCFEESDILNYEIIVIDDGSKDDSYNICRVHQNKHIKLYQQENMGVSHTRNRIIEKARGKWITFVDADDLINFKEYENAYRNLKTSNYDFYIKCDQINKLKLDDPKQLYRYIVEYEIINSVWKKFYKREILIDNNIRFDVNIELGEDLLFNIVYFEKSNNPGFFKNEVYRYRKINNNSLTSKYRSNKFEILMEVYEKCKETCFNRDVQDSFEYIRVKNCISCLKTELLHKKMSNEEIKSYVNHMKKYRRYEKIKTVSIRNKMVYWSWYHVTFFIKAIMKLLCRK